MGYHYVLLAEVAEFFCLLSRREREQCLKIFQSLADDPYQRGNFYTLDLLGRQIQHQTVPPWEISFWSNHADKEVRVVGLRKIRRR